MTTDKTPISWPLSADAWQAVERSARIERARALTAFGRSITGLVRRVFNATTETTIYLPSVRGRIGA